MTQEAEKVFTDRLNKTIAKHKDGGDTTFLFKRADTAGHVTLKKGDSFSRKTFADGDFFTITDCYIGKRGKLIFRATSQSGWLFEKDKYQWAEFSEDEGKKHLDGFRSWFADLVSDDLEVEISKIAVELATKERERAEAEAKMQDMDDWGSW